MTETDQPVAAVEAQKTSLRQTKDGLVISFLIQPHEQDIQALLNLPIYDIVNLLITKSNLGA